MYAPPTTLLTLVVRCCTVTGIANKLKLAGFATHQIGKWDAGMATPEHTPRGRGYDSSFGYYHHDNDYWTERLWATYNDPGTVRQCGTAVYVDLWLAEVGAPGRGAVGVNGSKPPHSAEKCQGVDDGEGCAVPFGVNGSIVAFEEWLFAQRAVQLIRAHDPSIPFFLNYDLHIAQ